MNFFSLHKKTLSFVMRLRELTAHGILISNEPVSFLVAKLTNTTFQQVEGNFRSNPNERH